MLIILRKHFKVLNVSLKHHFFKKNSTNILPRTTFIFWGFPHRRTCVPVFLFLFLRRLQGIFILKNKFMTVISIGGFDTHMEASIDLANFLPPTIAMCTVAPTHPCPRSWEHLDLTKLQGGEITIGGRKMGDSILWDTQPVCSRSQHASPKCIQPRGDFLSLGRCAILCMFTHSYLLLRSMGLSPRNCAQDCNLKLVHTC